MQALPDFAPQADDPVVAVAPARFAFPQGGDDMGRARSFCDDARLRMDQIVRAARDTASDPGRDPHWLCERLALIQQGAKRARARAVYRSAQDVLSLIHCNGPHLPIDWCQVDGRLLVLNKLIGQYADGVAEVEDACRVPDRAATGTLDAHARARDTLKDLLPHASEGERTALRRLVDWRMDAPETETEAHAPVPSAPRFALEDSLPDLVQRLLGHGRDYGKTLSVSYALDGVTLEAGARDAAVGALWDALAPRIAADLPLQGVGHLDIAASNAGLRVSGTGFAAFEIALEDQTPARTALASAPQPKPMITPDTEADLRAQLAALLDGGAA